MKGLGLRAGDRARLLIQDQEEDYTVGGLLQGESNEAIVMDLAMATEALRRDGSLDRILVKASSEHEGALRAASRRVYWLAMAPKQKRTACSPLRWNLRVLSYVALIVGASDLQHDFRFGGETPERDRSAARTRRHARGSAERFLGEAACFGVIGGLLGIALGRLMADAAVQGIAITVESLYVSSRPGEIEQRGRSRWQEC